MFNKEILTQYDIVNSISVWRNCIMHWIILPMTLNGNCFKFQVVCDYNYLITSFII